MNWKLTGQAWVKVVTGAAIAGAGAFLTYAADHVADLNLGDLGLLVSAAISVAINYLRKAGGTTPPEGGAA